MQLRTFDNGTCMGLAQGRDDLPITTVTRMKKTIENKAYRECLGQLPMFILGLAMSVACDVWKLLPRFLRKVH